MQFLTVYVKGKKHAIIWGNKYTGCPDQIRPIFKITLLPNYKTYRKSEDSFGIVGKMAKNNYLR